MPGGKLSGSVSEVFGPGVSVSVWRLYVWLAMSTPVTSLCLSDQVSNLNRASVWFAMIDSLSSRPARLRVTTIDDSGCPGVSGCRMPPGVTFDEAVRPLVAGDVVDRDVVVELVVERERAALQVHLLLVLLHEPVVVRRVHVGRSADLPGERDDRDAAVRLIVLVVVVVARRDQRGRADAPREGRRRAEAEEVDVVASDRLAVLRRAR